MTLTEYYTAQIEGNALAFMRAIDGKATDSARGSRINLISRYRFTDGALKGFMTGGAVRWRSAPTVGYGTRVNDSGVTVLDLDQAFKGDDELYVDAFIGYRGRFEFLGGVGYNVQLNIRNVLDEDGAVPVTINTQGDVIKLATVEPRLFVFTLGLDF
jgi:hypothetical protein